MDELTVDLSVARKALSAEGSTILALAGQIGASFAQAARAIFQCGGSVVLTGVGKAGIIAQKISATLASTGTRSIYLHPVEALHGDLGRVQRGDVVIALSHSGASEEIVRLLDHLKGRGATLVALTGDAASPLGKFADITVCYGQVEEACPHGLAPTVSTSCMLALGDAMALTVMQMRRFTPEDFATYHPGGSLGRKLLKVEEAMSFKEGQELRAVRDNLTLGAALEQAEKGRRTGAMLLVDEQGVLTGILTDADLRRVLVKAKNAKALEMPVSAIMTRNPKHIHVGELASEALAIINAHRIDELPVLDERGKPVGVVDVQDLLGIKTLAGGE